jgi:hypothetical protein
VAVAVVGVAVAVVGVAVAVVSVAVAVVLSPRRSAAARDARTRILAQPGTSAAAGFLGAAFSSFCGARRDGALQMRRDALRPRPPAGAARSRG